MRILLLGTAAAEGIPAPFCECPTCVHARTHGGRNVRMRTSVLIDDDLLIDPGPDLIAATQRFGRVLSRVETWLITHAHADHLLPSNLIWRTPPFRSTPVAPLRIFGPPPAIDLLYGYPAPQEYADSLHLVKAANATLEAVQAGQIWSSGGYRITAAPATHCGEQPALLYVISDGDQRVLYATDSGPLTDEGWRIVVREAPYSAVFMEETMGAVDTWGEHHDFHTFLEAKARFDKEGLLRPNARFVAFHFSHGGNPPHADLERFFDRYGVLVAYDGMELSL